MKSTARVLSLALLAVLLLVIGGRHLLTTDASGEVQALELSADDSDETAVGGALTERSLAVGLGPQRRVTIPTGATPPDSTALSAPLDRGRLLQVVDAANGAPLAEAFVTFLPASNFAPDHSVIPNEMLRAFLLEEDPEAVVNERGQRFQADDKGQLFVPDERGLIMGRAGDLWELVERLDAPPALDTLALVRDTSITVRVLDNTLRPMGGISISVVHDPELEPSLWVSADTDANMGAVRFAHLGRKVHDAHLGFFGRGGPLGTYSFACVVHQPEEARFVIDPLNLPTMPVDIVLAPSGSIEIRLVGPDIDVPLRDQVLTDLLEVGVDDEDAVEYWVNQCIPLQDVDEQGRSIYPTVGLGMELDAMIYFQNGGPQESVRVVGPKTPGERVIVEVPITFDYPIFSMRLVNDAGAPLVKTEVSVQLEQVVSGTEDEFTTDCSPSTNSEGRLRVHLKDLNSSEAVELTRMTLSPSSENETLNTAVHEVRGGLRHGVIELGDIVIRLAPVLLTGTVRTSSGQALEDASVSVHCSQPVAERGALRPHNRFWTNTDTLGHFRARGDSDAKLFDVQVWHEEYGMLRVANIAAGTTDLEIAYELGSELVGSVVLDPPLTSSLVEIHVEPADAEYAWKVLRSTEFHTNPNPDGSFRFKHLAPGKYNLTVEVDSYPGWQHTVSDIVIVSGEHYTSASLQGIQPPSMQLFEFFFVEASGKPVNWCEVLVKETDGRTEFADAVEVYTEGGYCSILTRYRSLDLKTSFGRFRERELFGIQASRKIELSPSPQAEFVLSESMLESLRGHHWWLEPQGEDFNSLIFYQDSGVGKIQVVYSTPRSVQVDLLLSTTEESEDSTSVHQWNVELFGQEALQHVELDSKGFDLKAALERVAKEAANEDEE